MAKLKFAASGKRDLHNLEEEFDNRLDKVELETWKFEKNKKLVLDYIKASKRGTAKSAGRNRKVKKSTLYRVLGILELLSETWLKKDFEEADKEYYEAEEIKESKRKKGLTLTDKDNSLWEKFYNRMEDDKLLNIYGKKFSSTTKTKNYKTIKKFLKYTFGNNKTYPDYCDNWACEESDEKTKDALTRSEIEKIVDTANTIKLKALIMILFDGGFRIEELANLRWIDLELKDAGYFQANVRAETSKSSKERKVSLLLSSDIIKTYKDWKKPKNDSEYLFETSYNKLYSSIKRLGEKIGKKISPHIMRHSSATYYASICKTYQQFTYRYGWSLKSSIPQSYYHPKTDDQTAEETKEHEIAKFKTEFEAVKVKNLELIETIQELRVEQKQMKSMQEQLFGVMKDKGWIEESS